MRKNTGIKPFKLLAYTGLIFCLSILFAGCPEGKNGRRFYNFYNNFDDAELYVKKSKNVRLAEFKINNVLRKVIYQHPPATIRYPAIRIAENSELVFRYGINEKNWKDGSDGAVFSIFAENANKKEKIFSRHINPSGKTEDRKWFKESISLEKYEGEKKSFVFKTECYSNCRNDGAGWADPEIISSSGDKKTNIILISIDTLRADALSCYGNQASVSPNIDKFARDSILFKNSYSTSTWTLPAHASMLTGLYPSEHEAVVCLKSDGETSGLPLKNSVKTVTESLKKKDYYTSAFVSCPWLKRDWNLTQGFLKYDDVWWKTRDRTAGRTAGRAIEWLKVHNDLPAFLFLHFYDPHAPYYPEEEKYREGLEGEFGDIDISEFHAWEVMEGKKDIPDESEAEMIKKYYDAEVEYVDYNISRIMKTLKDLGLYEESMIILTGDHGECFGEHDIWGHGYEPYPELTRVPLIVKPPGNHRGKKVESPVSLVSLAKTIAVEAGLKYEDFRGNNLLDIRENNESRSFIYSEVFHEHGIWRSFVSGGYNFLSLIDNENEITEKNHVYRDYSPVSDKEILKKLEDKYRKFRKRENLNEAINAPLNCDDSEIDEETRDLLKKLGYLN